MDEQVIADKVGIKNDTAIRATWFVMGAAVGIGLGWLGSSFYKKLKNRKDEPVLKLVEDSE